MKAEVAEVMGDTYPQRGLAAVNRSKLTWVYVAVCITHTALPLQWLEQ